MSMWLTYRMRWLGVGILLLLLACNRPKAPDCLQSAGEIISIERTFDQDITALELHNFIHVTIIESDENKVIVTAPENLIPEVITELNDGQLRIDDENTCDFVRRLDIQPHITVLANIESVVNFSQGDVSTYGPITAERFALDNWQASGRIQLELNCDSVFYKTHTGVSTTSLSGLAEFLYVYHRGMGPCNTTFVSCDRVSVRNNSINDVKVRADVHLTAWIESSGDIYYQGGPEIINIIQDGDGVVVPE